MISVCICVKDRSLVTTKNGVDLYLFPNCVKSIVEASKKLAFPIELIVVDYESTDFPLEEWIYDIVDDNFPIKIIKLPHDETFSKGKSLNLAAVNASYDYIFFGDAELLMDERVFNNGLKYLNEGKSYCPILFSYSNYKHDSGWWRDKNTAYIFVTKDMWKQVKIPEFYTWGKEDNMFSDSIAKITTLVRDNCEGLFHQWHPIVKESLYFFSNQQDHE